MADTKSVTSGLADTKSVISGAGRRRVSFFRGCLRPNHIWGKHIPGLAETKSVTSRAGRYRVSYILGRQKHPGLAETSSFTLKFPIIGSHPPPFWRAKIDRGIIETMRSTTNYLGGVSHVATPEFKTEKSGLSKVCLQA